MLTSAQTKAATTPDQRFVSLKWKALVFTSLVLLAVTILISHHSYQNLLQQFEVQRSANYQRYNREMRSFLQQSREHLTRLAAMVPYLPGLRDGFVEGNAPTLQAAFDPQWPVLQVDWGLERVAFFDTAGQLLADWRTDTWGTPQTTDTPNWLDAPLQQERASSGLHCHIECQVFAAVPVLIDGEHAGAVLVIGSLTDALHFLRELSGHDVGLLINEPHHNADSDTMLPQWGVRIAALTNPRTTRPVIEQSSSHSLTTVSSGIEVSVMDVIYDVVAIPLPYTRGREAFFVVIANISAQLAAIQASTRSVLLTAIGGWICSQCLLLAILWTPLSRLRHTADTLPLLARGEFRQFRLSQPQYHSRLHIPDEMDHLNHTAISLTHRLEHLEEEVAEHTLSLSKRMEELAQERDFVTSLLQTAQVMIITQDQNGRVLMVNPFVCTLTGYTGQELIGQDFAILLASSRRKELRHILAKEMAQTHRDHLNHESLVNCKDGTIRNIAWYHSRLNQHHDGDPLILSVGLDMTERRGAESRLAWLADHDVLTGLFNRRRFQEELETALREVHRHPQQGALLVIDLDQFKFINDTSGHQAGDLILKKVARILNQEPGTHIAARLGGDEFALLVRSTSADEMSQLARRLQNEFLTLEVPQDSEQALRISASMGIALFPDDANEVGELIACANLAVYKVKEEHRGGWHLFSSHDRTRERLRDRIYWKERVADALAHDRFELFLQPILNLRTQQVGHYEVLIRMRDTDGQLIPPGQFIDAAERSGMIHTLDRHVVSKALRQLSLLRQKNHDICLAINLSGHALSDPDLLHHIQWELEQHQVPPQRIIFEITETAAVADFAVASSLMLAVKELGCAFALDDFGIGFSSFYYLKHLPVDYLKIDGSFIRQLPDSLDDQIIVEAIAAVARGFGKKLIAEYVETDSTLPLLERYGVDFAQGFLIGRPQPLTSMFPELEAKSVVVPFRTGP